MAEGVQMTRLQAPGRTAIEIKTHADVNHYRDGSRRYCCSGVS
jgi:hypothetical protein